MSRLCTDQLNWVFWLAVAFLAASLLLGAISAIKAMMAKPPEPEDPNRIRALGLDGQPIGPILEALKGLIEALGKAPAWFALFLAGLFLFWLAGQVHVDACTPRTPVAANARPPGTPTPGGGTRTQTGNTQAPTGNTQ